MRLLLAYLTELPVFTFLGTGSSKWVEVNEKKTLHEVLKERNFVIPGIPGLHSVPLQVFV